MYHVCIFESRNLQYLLSSKNLSHVRKLDVSFEFGELHIDPKTILQY